MRLPFVVSATGPAPSGYGAGGRLEAGDQRFAHRREAAAGALEPQTTDRPDPTSAFSRRGRLGLALSWLELAALAAQLGLIGLIAAATGP